MSTSEQKKKLLKAKIVVALHVMYKAVLGLHFQRQQQKKNGQLAIF
jgi:hypothetical protein